SAGPAARGRSRHRGGAVRCGRPRRPDRDHARPARRGFPRGARPRPGCLRRRDRQRRRDRPGTLLAGDGHRVRPTVGRTSAVLFFFLAMAVAMPWPQAAHLATHVPAFDDSLLNIWRISWIAHALSTPATLVDTNIFHP